MLVLAEIGNYMMDVRVSFNDNDSIWFVARLNCEPKRNNLMKHRRWSCLRCAGNEYETGEIRVAGGFWSRVFDVQNKKYSAVTCERCGFTEFYKCDVSTLGNVFDFFTR